MATGHKTGGRKAGTPNKKTREVAELLRSLNCDPIRGMAEIAMNEQNSPDLRGRMYSDLAQYVYPKRKAVQLSSDEGPVEIRVSWMDRHSADQTEQDDEQSET